MQIEIDEKKILTEIFEIDGSLHQKIRESVRNDLVEKIKKDIENEYFGNSFYNRQVEEVKDQVLEEIEKVQTKSVKKILSTFYDSYRFGKKDLTILKKLKEFIEEN